MNKLENDWMDGWVDGWMDGDGIVVRSKVNVNMTMKEYADWSNQKLCVAMWYSVVYCDVIWCRTVVCEDELRYDTKYYDII